MTTQKNGACQTTYTRMPLYTEEERKKIFSAPEIALSVEKDEESKTPVPLHIDTHAIMTHGPLFNRMIMLANAMSRSDCMVPSHYRGKPDACLAIVMQAARWGIDPFVVAQKTHLIRGVLGYEAQLINAVISSSKSIIGRILYTYFGDWQRIMRKMAEKISRREDTPGPGWAPADEEGVGVRISATLRGEDTPRELELYLMQAFVRNSPLWHSDPKQQLSYLGIKKWARLHCPEVILGVYSTDEAKEIADRQAKDLPETSPERQETSVTETLLAEINLSRDESELQKTETMFRRQHEKGWISEKTLKMLEEHTGKRRNDFKIIPKIHGMIDRLQGDRMRFQMLKKYVSEKRYLLTEKSYTQIKIALDDLQVEYQ